jgi:hypothetical protein
MDFQKRIGLIFSGGLRIIFNREENSVVMFIMLQIHIGIMRKEEINIRRRKKDLSIAFSPRRS